MDKKLKTMTNIRELDVVNADGKKDRITVEIKLSFPPEFQWLARVLQAGLEFRINNFERDHGKAGG